MLRHVTSAAAIQWLQLQSTNLYSGYLQTVNEDTNMFLQFDQEIIEGLEKDWRAAVQEGIDYLRLGGKEELSAQQLRLPLPLRRGLAPRPRHGSSSPSSSKCTGKGDAVRSFIAQYQDVFMSNLFVVAGLGSTPSHLFSTEGVIPQGGSSCCLATWTV